MKVKPVNWLNTEEHLGMKTAQSYGQNLSQEIKNDI